MKVKNLVGVGIAIVAILLLIAWGWHSYMQGEVTLTLEQMAKKKILITYYQRTDDVTRVANTIHDLVGGDIIKIEPESEYPVDNSAYIERVRTEREKRIIVPIKTKLSVKHYDIIFVGTPSPINTVAPPMKAFLVKNNKDLKKKVVIPFITYDSSSKAMGAFRDIGYQIPEAYIKNPYITKEGIKTGQKVSISRWLKLIKFKRYEIK